MTFVICLEHEVVFNFTTDIFIQEYMDTLHRHLERSRHMQTALRAFEARDRNLLEENLWRVSFWSCASMLVMLCVALTQVNKICRCQMRKVKLRCAVN